MGMRSPNRSQFWFCAKCNKQTVHNIPDLDSGRTKVGSLSAFQRWHRCTECFSNLRTCEVRGSQLEAMVAELDQLRALKVEHEKLQAAVRARRRADAEIDALVQMEGIESAD